MLRIDVETDAISRTGIIIRIVGAGLVFGLTVWAILPLIVLPVWVTTLGVGDQTFSSVAAGSLLGHALFGVVLGAVFATVVDLREPTLESADAGSAGGETASDSMDSSGRSGGELGDGRSSAVSTEDQP